MEKAGLWLLVLFLICLSSPSRGGEEEATDKPVSAKAFAFLLVEKRARELAERTYEEADDSVPEHLLELTEEQWRSFRLKREHALWAQSGFPFVVEYIYPGFLFNRTVKLNLVTADRIEELSFSPDMFETDSPDLAGRMGEAAGFAGFAVRPAEPALPASHIPAGMTGESGTVGSSHFLFSGRHAGAGTYSRPAMFNTELQAGEVPPYFRELWLIEPKPGAQSMEVFALMDSPAAAGAFRMEIVPGATVATRVAGKLFLRPGAARPAKIGIAPLTSMFLFSESQNGSPEDYRPEVHNADGLLLAGADGSWQWRPLANGQRLLVSLFQADAPKGFGLLQRDGDFDHYQDLDARYERRTSVWIEPEGDWGPGALELVEVPASKDFHSNVIAFWTPDPQRLAAKPAAPGDETDPLSPPGMSFGYTINWMPPGVPLHSLGKVGNTRILRSSQDGIVTFILDFEGDELDALDGNTGLTSVVGAPEEAPLVDKSLIKNQVTGDWRVTVRFRLPQDGVLERLIAVRDGPPVLRFTVYLKKGENIPGPLTETWVYDYTP